MSARKKGPLSDTDKQLWDTVAATVTPLGARPDAPPIPPRRMVRPLEREAELPSEWFAGTGPAPDTSIDRKTRRRLARGHMAVSRSVDLHGMSQETAQRLLKRTIEDAVRAGEKALIVVTGKGGRRFSQIGDIPAAFRTRESFNQFGGVLKRMVPLWLEGPELRPFIQSYGTAAIEHGGEGALYVLLRRRVPGSKGMGA
ncbi:MAG: hypothetical protein EP335_06380 [Alphaproteobacteria bacterium]|nr:MAG: hypothetical protein EP335_06380 [Alphaproteobacteria bacterium]